MPSGGDENQGIYFMWPNVINFQQMFLAKTNILFNIPILYAICKRAGLF